MYVCIILNLGGYLEKLMGHTNDNHYQLITKHSTTKVKAKTLKQFKNLKDEELTEDKLLRLRLTQKGLQLPF